MNIQAPMGHFKATASYRPSRRMATRTAFKVVTTFSALALSLTLAACGNGSSSSQSSSSPSTSSSSTSTPMAQLAGVTASGSLGKEPKISFDTPKTVENNSYAVLQDGNGEKVQEGDRVCMQSVAYNAEDGSQVANTWTKNTPDCTLVIDKNSLTDNYYKLFKGRKLNTTFAFGINDTSEEESASYIMTMTMVSRQKALTRAEGEKVSDIPDSLPKVKLASDGKPSLDLNGYKSDGKLVSQTLIKGTGKKVGATSTVSANYTGWTVDSNGKLKQFDSSWTRGSAASFSLDGQVITGWTKGLTDQTVGSQVLLVIPPSEGYGSEAQTDSSGNVTIPANSTLYFVIDILYAS